MQPEQPKSSKWLWITLIIVAVLAAGFFGWYYLMGPGKKVENKTTTNNIETPKTATNTSPVEAPTGEPKVEQDAPASSTETPQPSNEQPVATEENCLKEGEAYGSDGQEPKACCAGLTPNSSGFDTRTSVADKCYSTNLESGLPSGTCINCGDGICKESETVCNCPQDCVGQNKSVFKTVEEYCTGNKLRYICDLQEYPFNADLEICKLCSN